MERRCSNCRWNGSEETCGLCTSFDSWIPPERSYAKWESIPLKEKIELKGNKGIIFIGMLIYGGLLCCYGEISNILQLIAVLLVLALLLCNVPEFKDKN